MEEFRGILNDEGLVSYNQVLFDNMACFNDVVWSIDLDSEQVHIMHDNIEPSRVETECSLAELRERIRNQYPGENKEIVDRYTVEHLRSLKETTYYNNPTFVSKGRKFRIHQVMTPELDASGAVRRVYVSGTNIQNFITKKEIKGEVYKTVSMILSQAKSMEAGINDSLRFIGETLNVSRVYIFENDPEDPRFCNNTFEWCAEGIEPEIDLLQHISYEEYGYDELFSQMQFFCCANVSELKDAKRDILEQQNIKAIMNYAFYDKQVFSGFIGIDDCVMKRPDWEPDSETADLVGFIGDLLTTYLIKERNLVHALESEAETEKLSRRSQEFLGMLESLVGCAPWYIYFNEDGSEREINWSQMLRQMLGYENETDFPNTYESWIRSIHEDDREEIVEAGRQARDKTGFFDRKYRGVKKDGTVIWIKTQATANFYENGKPRLLYGTFLDITEEEKLRQKELASTKALEEAFEAANRANEAKTNFMASMSHDIRTPLNAIVGMTAIAETHAEDNEKVSHCLAEIHKASRHLLSLVNKVLDMNRIESGQISLNMESFDLSVLLDTVISISHPLMREKNHEFIVNVRDIRHEKLFGDHDHIQQFLMNFIGNAIKYTPYGGKIGLTVTEIACNRPKRGCFEFIVEDNGIGMSPKFLEHIFEPFARAEEDERVLKENGTGLGMPIAKNIVQMMSGDIKVESELNAGTKITATIFLEIQDEEDVRIEEGLRGRSVLIVDDEISSCEAAWTVLNGMGMKAEWAYTGEEALQKASVRKEQGNGYETIILDWKMPGMEGVDVTKRLRNIIGDQVPVFILSSYDWNDIEEEARSAGVDAFISKPLFRSKVTHAFKHLSEKGPDKEKEISLSEYQEVDFSTKRVLLVEDNELNAEIAVEILGMTGLNVDHVWNGKEGVDRMESSEDGAYDMIFMDIQMPVMNGHEATRAIRSSEREYLRKIPIIAMSANAFAEDVKQSKESGMNDHLPKPLDFERLIASLRQWLV